MPAARAQGGVGKAKAAAFDTRTFAGPLAAKAYACFVRRYDTNHLARHPKQKLGAMKLQPCVMPTWLRNAVSIWNPRS